MAGKNTVTLTFAGDADKLSKTFSEVEKKSQDLDSSVRKSSKSIEQSKDAFDKAADGADNTYDKFDSLESLGRGTTDTMSGLADIMAGNVLQGSTDLAGGVAALADGFKGALLPALKSAVGGLKAAGVAVKTFTLSLLTNPIFLVVTALAALGVGLKIAYDHSEKFRNGVNAVWNNIKAVVLPILKAVWDAVVATFEGWLNSIEKVLRILPGGNALLEKLGENAKGAGDAMKDTGPAAEDWEHAQKRLNDEVEISNRTIQTQLDLLDKWYGEVKSQEEATIGYAQSVADADASLKANGKTVDVSTEKGRANRQSLLDLADGNKDLVDAMRANGAQSDKLVTQNEAGRKKFLAVAEAMGLPKAEAKALAEQLFKIPEAKSTKVSAPGAAAAKQNVESLLGQINLLPNYKTIQIRYTQSGVNLTTPSSVGRNHTGGVVPGSPGTERLSILQAGERIIPAHRAEQGAKIVLQSDGTRVGELLVQMIKESVRVRGGNVQVVLGGGS